MWNEQRRRLPACGWELALETAGVLVGAGIAAHGGAILIRNATDPLSKADDPTLYYGSNTGDTRRNARILRKKMEEAGIQAPPDTQPHHIVPSRSQNQHARQSRELLERWGIDINSADNGTYLPKRIHDGLANDHTYMQSVFQDLSQAGSKEDSIKILQDIAQQLLDGTYPRAGR